MLRPEQLLCPRPEGLYCPPGDFYVDPVRPVARAVITHGHSDHARAGHGTVLATPETLAIMSERYGEDFTAQRQAVAYGEVSSRDGVEVSLRPAGHVLGSSQAVVRWKGMTIVVSGDYKPPPDPWSTWALLGGRGAGKTLAGARWLRDRAFAGTPEQQSERRLALVGPTLHDVREVMVCGPSGLLNLPGPRPDWRPSRRRLEWPNGCVAYAFSAEEPERLRRPQLEAAWLDEFCTYRRPDETLSLLRMGLRLGEDPRLVVTTTPRPNAAFRRLLAEPSTVGVHAATAENADNLAPGFLQNLHAIYGGTRLERQELGGELLADADGALWRRQDLDLCRADRPDRLEKVVVAVDPPAGSGSSNGSGAACGIVVAGRLHGRAYVLADRTVHGLTPDGWARAVADAARAYGAQAIVAETNQGGDMVKSVLQTAAPPCAIRKVTASASKRVRAEPVAALYEQRRVFHCAPFPALEEELLSFGAAEPSRGAKSPDRADALVWAVTDLLLSTSSEGPRARWG